VFAGTEEDVRDFVKCGELGVGDLPGKVDVTGAEPGHQMMERREVFFIAAIRPDE
jgi:hypothetical protein